MIGKPCGCARGFRWSWLRDDRSDSFSAVPRRAAMLLMLALSATGPAACSRGQSSKAYAIGVVPKGTTHEFWKSIHAGAIKAARELEGRGIKVNITWKGPLREDDREQQVQVIEGFLSQGMNGIVLAPLDDRALVRPGRRGETRRDPDRHHGLGPRVRSDRQLRRHRQPEGRRAGGRPHGPAARQQGQGAAAPLPGRVPRAPRSARTGSCSG